MSARDHRHGPGRITAAVLGAPLAALLVAIALPAVVPASGDVRYFLGIAVSVPALVAFPCLALLARSGARAWAAVGLVSLASLAVLWSAWP